MPRNVDYMNQGHNPRETLKGSFLRKLRENLGVTQKEVGDAIARAQTWVSRREDGDHNITMVAIQRFVKGIGIASGKGQPLVTITFTFDDGTELEYEFD